MKTIALTQGVSAIVDDEDYESLSKNKWYAVNVNYTYYAHRAARNADNNRSTLQMHRAILNPPNGMQVDHIDGNGLNNQKSNLRIVTCRGNLQNKHRTNNGSPKTSKYPGVYLYRGKFWRAQIYIDGVLHDLGCHTNEEIAYSKYVEACKMLV